MRVARPEVVMPDRLADGVVAIPVIPVHVCAQPVNGARGPELLADVLEVPVVGDSGSALVSLDLVAVEDAVLELVQVAVLELVGVEEPRVVILHGEVHAPKVACVLAVGIRRGLGRAGQGAEMKKVRVRCRHAEQVPDE